MRENFCCSIYVAAQWSEQRAPSCCVSISFTPLPSHATPRCQYEHGWKCGGEKGTGYPLTPSQQRCRPRPARPTRAAREFRFQNPRSCLALGQDEIRGCRALPPSTKTQELIDSRQKNTHTHTRGSALARLIHFFGSAFEFCSVQRPIFLST